MIHDLGPRTRRIYDLLRERILSGELPPGTRLPAHQQLAAEFGVASMTIRHVLACLEEQHLVSRELGRGTFVRGGAETRSVLIVASAPLADELGWCVREAGIRARSVADFDTARALLEQTRVSLILVQLLPRAREFLRLVQDRWPHATIVAVIASVQDLEPLLGTPELPTRVLSAPLRAAQVREALSSAVDAPRDGLSVERLTDPALLVAQRTGRVQAVNTAAAQLLGCSPGVSLARLIPERVQAELRAMRTSVLEAPGPLELPLLAADGREVTVELTASRLGRATALLVLRDRSTQRASEQRLSFLSQLLEAVEQAVVATDLQARIIYWNTGAERLYGWRTDEALGRNAGDVIVAPELLKRGLEIMEQLRQGRSWSGEFPVLRKDGTTVPVLVTDSPVFDEDGRLAAVIGVAADLTERKRAEADRLVRARLEARLLAAEAALVREIASRLSP